MESTFCDRCSHTIKVNVGSTGPNAGIRQHGITLCHDCADKFQDMFADFQRSGIPENGTINNVPLDQGGIPFKPTKLIPTVKEEFEADQDEEEDENGDS